MELLRGTSVAERLRTIGPLAPGFALPIFMQVCRALDAAHQLGIVHRDLKPGNVFVCDDRVDQGARLRHEQVCRSRVADARRLHARHARIHGARAVHRRAVEPRTDLYAFGVMMYEALTGEIPIRGRNRRELLELHQRALPMSMRERRPDLDIPAELDARGADLPVPSAWTIGRAARAPSNASSPRFHRSGCCPSTRRALRAARRAALQRDPRTEPHSTVAPSGLRAAIIARGMPKRIVLLVLLLRAARSRRATSRRSRTSCERAKRSLRSPSATTAGSSTRSSWSPPTRSTPRAGSRSCPACGWRCPRSRTAASSAAKPGRCSPTSCWARRAAPTCSPPPTARAPGCRPKMPRTSWCRTTCR